jgi:hypothetical protein
MGKTPRQKLKLAAIVDKQRRLSFGKQSSESPGTKSKKHRANEIAFGNKFALALEQAFELFDLDDSDADDAFLLLAWTCWAIYGGKRKGQPTKWTTEAQEQLISDCDRLSAKKPNLSSETEICAALCKGVESLPRYQGLTGSSLRRRLQDAKGNKKRDQRQQRLADRMAKNGRR